MLRWTVLVFMDSAQGKGHKLIQTMFLHPLPARCPFRGLKRWKSLSARLELCGWWSRTPYYPVIKNEELMVMSEITGAMLTKIIYLNHCTMITSRCSK
jgi:hypothetical protein